jgi:hypothetical protein
VVLNEVTQTDAFPASLIRTNLSSADYYRYMRVYMRSPCDCSCQRLAVIAESLNARCMRLDLLVQS